MSRRFEVPSTLGQRDRFLFPVSWHPAHAEQHHHRLPLCSSAEHTRGRGLREEGSIVKQTGPFLPSTVGRYSTDGMQDGQLVTVAPHCPKCHKNMSNIASSPPPPLSAAVHLVLAPRPLHPPLPSAPFAYATLHHPQAHFPARGQFCSRENRSEAPCHSSFLLIGPEVVGP